MKWIGAKVVKSKKSKARRQMIKCRLVWRILQFSLMQAIRFWGKMRDFQDNQSATGILKGVVNLVCFCKKLNDEIFCYNDWGQKGDFCNCGKQLVMKELFSFLVWWAQMERNLCFLAQQDSCKWRNMIWEREREIILLSRKRYVMWWFSWWEIAFCLCVYIYIFTV